MKQSHRTGEIIHRLNSELYWDKEYLDEVRQFSVQLLLNRLVFSPGEFFVLGNGFVRTVRIKFLFFKLCLLNCDVLYFAVSFFGGDVRSDFRTNEQP